MKMAIVSRDDLHDIVFNAIRRVITETTSLENGMSLASDIDDTLKELSKDFPREFADHFGIALKKRDNE